MDLEKIDLKNAVTLVIKGFLYFRCVCPRDIVSDHSITALPAAMSYILKAESDDRREGRRKLYRIIAGSAVRR